MRALRTTRAQTRSCLPVTSTSSCVASMDDVLDATEHAAALKMHQLSAHLRILWRWRPWTLLLLCIHSCSAINSQPRFYVYDLPPSLRNLAHDEHLDRNTGLRLQAALKSTGLVTQVPHRADYFLIPVYPMGAQESYDTFELALHHIQTAHPYWNATTRANHIAVGAWDFGLMQLAGLSDFKRIVHIHHFGWLNASMPWQVTVDGRCRFHAGDRCLMLREHLGPKHGVHRPGFDLIVPDVFEWQLKKRRPPMPRTTKVFFAGSGTNIYRADVFELYSNVSGWRIVQGRVQLDLELSQSVFCLDLGAAGFSTRFTHAMIHDCVPVWIDELLPPWHGVLPIESFSVKFGVNDLPRLPSVIDSITPERTAELQANVRKYSRYYHWSRVFGPTHDEPYPDAFDLLMEVLANATACGPEPCLHNKTSPFPLLNHGARAAVQPDQHLRSA